MQQSVSIRELTKAHKVRGFVLHQYERARLLTPWLSGGMRRYSMADARRLKTLLELAKMGLNAGEMRELLADDPEPSPDRIERMLKRFTAKRDMLTNRIDRLRSYVGRGE